VEGDSRLQERPIGSTASWQGPRRYSDDTTLLDDGSTILATLAGFSGGKDQVSELLLRFDILHKLWDSGTSPHYTPAGTDGNDSSSDSDNGTAWTASEVLTTLLACLGFTCGSPTCARPCNERSCYDITSDSANGLLQFSAATQRQERHHMADFVDKLTHLVAQHIDQSGDAPDREVASAWTLIEHQVTRFVGQQRLARAAEYLANRAARRGEWANQPPFAAAAAGGLGLHQS
jgi:hypothetical protein